MDSGFGNESEEKIMAETMKPPNHEEKVSYSTMMKIISLGLVELDVS